MGKEILMCPGPTEYSPKVLQAMVRPCIAHYDRKIFELYDETVEMLSKIYQTKDDVIILPGTGRTAMEAAATSVVEPGDRILTIVSGLFGEWWIKIIKRLNAKPIKLEFEWGKPIDTKVIDKKLRQEDVKALTIAHCETSTGVVSPIKEVGELARKHDVSYLVDAIASLGGMEVKTHDWDIDLCGAASQKCLAAPIGLCFVSVSERAWEAMENRRSVSPSYSLDLLRWKTMWLKKPIPRPYPIYPSPNLLYALNEACKMILEEGLRTRFNRHRLAGEATRAGVKAIGLDLFPDESVASDTVTVIHKAEKIDPSQLRKLMKRKYGVYIGGAPPTEKLRGRIIRIGHMGLQASPQYILPTLSALEMALDDLGFTFKFGEGVKAAKEVFGTK